MTWPSDPDPRVAGRRGVWDDDRCPADLRRSCLPGLDHRRRKDTHRVGRVREIHRLRRRVRLGAPDPWLTRYSGMAAVTELVDRLAMIRLLDAAIGPIKSRDRGFTAGQVLVGLAHA